MRQGGLKVYTTIDLDLQKAARKAIAGQLDQRGRSERRDRRRIDPRNGYIRAMASSAQATARSKFNLAAQGHRQPGSTFKVMVLMAALRRASTPTRTTYDSHPLELSRRRRRRSKVQTYAHSYGGR